MKVYEGFGIYCRTQLGIHRAAYYIGPELYTWGREVYATTSDMEGLLKETDCLLCLQEKGKINLSNQLGISQRYTAAINFLKYADAVL